MESIKNLTNKLNDLERKLYAIRHLNNVVYTDAVTAAPSDSAAGRSFALEYLSEREYELTASPETKALLTELKTRRDEINAQQYRQAEYLLEAQERTAAIPQTEYVAYGTLLNEAEGVWEKAKHENDFEAFAPYLEKIVETNIRFAEYWDPKGEKDPYDVLLDTYEKGMSMKEYDAFFEALKGAIVPLVKQIREKGKQPDVSFLKIEYPIELQKKLSSELMKLLTIDPTHCTLAESEHPFTNSQNKDDVRITTHYHLNDPMSSFYSVVHEGGHALYELHIGDGLRYTTISDGASCGVHEGQSRFFENMIGRSREFCGTVLPIMKSIFPQQLEGVSDEAFYRAVNRAEPSLIRTESDELTYCLHIMVRYEIEKGLIHREISVADLPRIWNEKMMEYLSVEVPDNTHGVLQDSHWAGGSFGYFPTYALGNAYAAQTAEVMSRDVDIAKCCAEGNLSPIVNWLSEHIYQYGCLYEPRELMRRCWNEEFTPQPYINYLTKKYSELYEIEE